MRRGGGAHYANGKLHFWAAGGDGAELLQCELIVVLPLLAADKRRLEHAAAIPERRGLPNPKP